MAGNNDQASIFRNLSYYASVGESGNAAGGGSLQIAGVPGDDRATPTDYLGAGVTSTEAYLNHFVNDIIGGVQTMLVLCNHTTDRFNKDFMKRGEIFQGEVVQFRLPYYTAANKGRRMKVEPRVDRMRQFVVDEQVNWSTDWNVIKETFVSRGDYTSTENPYTKQGNYKMFEQIEKDVGIAAAYGINQVITVAGPRLGIENFTDVGTYFREMAIPGMIKMMVTPTTESDNALTLLGTKIDDANANQNISGQREIFHRGLRGYSMNNITLQTSTLLPVHTTGVLFENGLIEDNTVNNVHATVDSVKSRTSTGAPYMLMNSAFWPNGPYTQGQPTSVTVPAQGARTTENQLYLWGVKSIGTMKTQLSITDDADVPPLLRRGDVIVIENVRLVQLQSKDPKSYWASFTVCEDVLFPSGDAAVGPAGGATTGHSVLVKISPSMNPGRHQLSSDSKPYIAQLQNFMTNKAYTYENQDKNYTSLENFQNVTAAPAMGARVSVIPGLRGLTQYKVEYACPMTAIALSVLPPNTADSLPGAVKWNPAPGLNYGMTYHMDGTIETLHELCRFDSLYGVDVIIDDYCIKHFVEFELHPDRLIQHF